MEVLFANSSIGTDFTNNPGDATRQGLDCAIQADVLACHYVRTDGIAFVAGAVKFGLAHVRVPSQVPDLAKLKSHAGGDNLDVYLIGGIAAQAEPAASVVSYFSGPLGFGTASGVDKVYAHVQKPNMHTLGRTDSTGHVPGFVAYVGATNYMIGTHSLLGCVGVLVVPHGVVVRVRKIHIYDTVHTLVGGIGQFHTNTLTTQQL